MKPEKKYIPAISFSWLTPFYDPLIRLAMREDEFKSRLIRNANLQPGQAILDLGCGTATLTIMVKRACPQTDVIGLDGDPQILVIARQKVERAGLAIRLERGMAFDLPYSGDAFDRVLSSLVIHHLSGEDKLRTFGEVYRVLRPTGELHILDFGPPNGLYARLVSGLLSHQEPVADNIQGRLAGMMRTAGFGMVETLGRTGTVFGTLVYYKAVKEIRP